MKSYNMSTCIVHVFDIYTFMLSQITKPMKFNIVSLMFSLFFILQTVKIQAQEVETIADNLYRSEDLEVDSLNNLFVCGMDVGIAYVGKLDTAGQVVWYSFFDTLLLPTPGGESKSFSFIHLLADGTGGVYAFGRYEHWFDKAAVVHLNSDGELDWITNEMQCDAFTISISTDIFWQTDSNLFVASYVERPNVEESTVFYKLSKSTGEIEKMIEEIGLSIFYTTEHPYYDSQWHFQTSTGIVGVNEALEITLTDYGFTNETYPGDWVLKSDDFYLHTANKKVIQYGSFSVWKPYLIRTTNNFNSKDSMQISDLNYLSIYDTSLAVIDYGEGNTIQFSNEYGFAVSGSASWVHNDTTHYAIWYGQVNPDDGLVETEYVTEQINSHLPSKVAVLGEQAYYLESSWYTSRIKKWQLTPIEFETQVISSVEEQTIQHKDLKIYPNPTEGEVIVWSEVPIQQIEVYSLTGQLVETQKPLTTQVNLTLKNSGVYLVRIMQSGGKTLTQKVIKW